MRVGKYLGGWKSTPTLPRETARKRRRAAWAAACSNFRTRSGGEISLLRVVEEGLTNIHRRSHASEAGVNIVIQDGSVRMEITDSGCGIPQDLLREWREMRAPLGVGMAGMLERTRDMGGSF